MASWRQSDIAILHSRVINCFEQAPVNGEFKWIKQIHLDEIKSYRIKNLKGHSKLKKTFYFIIIIIIIIITTTTIIARK